MGLFAKVNETSKPGGAPPNPAPVTENTTAMPNDMQTDHPSQGGLFVRAQALAGKPASNDCVPSAEEVIYDTCHARLERVSPGDCDTALSILKTFYPLDTLILFHAPFDAPRIYASFGIELGQSIQKALEEDLAAAIPPLLASPLEAILPFGREQLPRALALYKKDHFFLVPIAQGTEALALLSTGKDNGVPDEIRRILSGTLSDRFILHREQRQRAGAKAQVQPDWVQPLFDTPEKILDILLVEQLADAANIASLAARALPRELRVMALDAKNILISCPPRLDIELIWHHLLRGPLSGTGASHAQVSLLAALDKDSLATALGKRGYGNRPN